MVLVFRENHFLMETPAPLGVVLVVTAFNFPHAVGDVLWSRSSRVSFDVIVLMTVPSLIGLLLELCTLIHLWKFDHLEALSYNSVSLR